MNTMHRRELEDLRKKRSAGTLTKAETIRLAKLEAAYGCITYVVI